MKKLFTLINVLRVIVAGILLQTLYFKFTAAPESVYIFQTLGMEPWGRIGSGLLELAASVFLLFRSTTWLGALLAMGSMAGAIFFHLTTLGIEVMEDGGLLFGLACTIFIASAIILWIERQKIPLVNRYLFEVK